MMTTGIQLDAADRRMERDRVRRALRRWNRRRQRRTAETYGVLVLICTLAAALVAFGMLAGGAL